MRKEKGITLIALIVTIIILLILAGIAIISLTGENGLISRAQFAVEKTKEAEAVEVMELQLISCRLEYRLNRNVNIPSYVEKENKKITVEVDNNLNPDNNPVGQWTMMYGGYVFEIYNLEIQNQYKAGKQIRPSIKDKKVTEEYQFASINDSKIDVEFKVEIPEELSGSTVSVNVITEATGIVEGTYDDLTGIYTGVIKTDGTSKTNGTYTYEIKAIKSGEEYTTKTVVTIDKFLTDPEIEVSEESKKWNELTINLKTSYPKEAGLFYKYYISDSETYEEEEFTQEISVIKKELEAETEYNIKAEVYLKDKTTKVETIMQETTPEKMTEIRYIEDLEAINDDLTANYKLMNDLDFKQRSSYKTQEKYEYYNLDEDGDGFPDTSWIPIGNDSATFNGILDGQYHSINNLWIRSDVASVGLFGQVGSVIIKNLKLENVDILSDGSRTGKYVGGLIGVSSGSNVVEIENVGVSGYIGANGKTNIYPKYVGGLIGAGIGSLKNVYSECEVYGTGVNGAFIGIIRKSDYPTLIEDSYAIGLVVSNSRSGANSGGMYGTYQNFNVSVNRCYSLVEVNLVEPIGNTEYDIIDSYWTREKSGNVIATAKGTEIELISMFNKATFENWDFKNVWQIDEGNTVPYLKWAGKRDAVKRENVMDGVE